MLSRFFPSSKRPLASLSEQDVLALAISNEEDDGRIYLAYADALRDDYPHSAKIFEDMAEEESHHRQMLIDLHTARFGNRIPLVRREHVREFPERKADWLIRTLPVSEARKQAEAMEESAHRFYLQAAGRTTDAATRKLLGDLALAENPGLPVFLFGHSMGGMIAAATAEAHPQAFDGLAIWNSDLNPGLAGKFGRLLLLAERALKGSDVPSSFGPQFTFRPWARSIPDRRTEFDWLSHDPAEVDAYGADPLCGVDGTVSLWLDVVDLATGAGSKAGLNKLARTLPIHLVGGGQDPATGGGQAMQWLAGRMTSMGFLNVSLTLYAGMRHETLKEFGRAEAMSAFAAWADSVVSGETGTP